jgi:hypothetical protein
MREEPEQRSDPRYREDHSDQDHGRWSVVNDAPEFTRNPHRLWFSVRMHLDAW